MKNKREKVLNISVIFTLIVLSYSLYNLNQIEKYEEDYKQEVLNKYDQNYWKFINNFSTLRTGEYYNRTGNILIYTNNRSMENVVATCYHEIMHYYWNWNFLDGEAKEEYIQIYNNATTYVSKHAKKNVFEDFAETYVCFKAKKCSSPISKERLIFMYKYMEDIV
jgi:hypothetical protein|tara:strand:+ start:1368 stop:1862 length:495 start_codon:yes stop_codon:yes gene_type:complete